MAMTNLILMFFSDHLVITIATHNSDFGYNAETGNETKVYENGGVYVGNLVNGLRDGYGRYEFNNSSPAGICTFCWWFVPIS